MEVPWTTTGKTDPQSSRHGAVQLTIITSTPQSVSRGSGTYVAATTLQRGLEQLGHAVRLICPSRAPGMLGHTLQRFAFNLSLSADRTKSSEVVLGLDLDGFTLAGRVHPFVCYVLGTLADEAGFERGWTAQLLRLQASAEQRSARHADLVITTSEYSAGRIAHLYGIERDRIGIVPPAFDVTRWQADLSSMGDAARPDARPTVLCVARMYPRKNIRALIAAARMLVDSGVEFAVRIVGDGPERRRLERMTRALGLAHVVDFAGQRPHAELAASFASCDVFCLPSLQEGFGIVFAEAMASGKPIVGLRASSTPELIEHGVNGQLAEPHDETDLAEQLRHLLERPQLRAQMGRANLAKVATYDLTRTTTRLLDLIARVT